MAFKLRICKNDTTALLRETFQATPLRVPEARIQPLIVVAHRDNNIQFRGELKFLLKDPDGLNIGLNIDPVANVALNRTKKTDISVGMDILDGFLQGLKMSPASVGVALKGAKEISFSFTNVQRHWIDLGELGGIVRNNRLDMENPAIDVFKGEDPPAFLLVSSAIVSNGFGINLESGQENAFEVGVPLIQDFVAKAKLNVKVESKLKSNISFEGDVPLTFAFSCVRVNFNAETGAISLLEEVNPKNRGLETRKELSVIPVALDEDEFEPGLLSWD